MISKFWVFIVRHRLMRLREENGVSFVAVFCEYVAIHRISLHCFSLKGNGEPDVASTT